MLFTRAQAHIEVIQNSWSLHVPFYSMLSGLEQHPLCARLEH